jgi:acyl-CoA dehydrogenase
MEEALSLMCRRLATREAFGRPLIEDSLWQHRIADSRINIDTVRLLTLEAAAIMDRYGSKAAKKQIAMVKVAAPRMAQAVIDMAIQAHGAGGLSQHTVLPELFLAARAVRFADGPDEVHSRAVGRYESMQQQAAS